ESLAPALQVALDRLLQRQSSVDELTQPGVAGAQPLQGRQCVDLGEAGVLEGLTLLAQLLHGRGGELDAVHGPLVAMDGAGGARTGGGRPRGSLYVSRASCRAFSAVMMASRDCW